MSQDPDDPVVPDTDAVAKPDLSAADTVPSNKPSWSDRLSWTPRQRRGMAVLLGLVLVILLWRAVRNPTHISDPQPAKPARFDELADRLDPNTATWTQLAAIPSLGERRAKAIVDHREDWKKRHPGEAPYHAPIDLAAVSGIGATMIEQMTPHLMFPRTPDSKPAN